MKQFKIPLESEVEKYMKEKKGWPDEFCKYYAEKFYNFYMSNGWKVSGKSPMRDWKAAFNSNWQTLKFKEDVDFLNKHKPMKNGAEKSGDPNINYLNELLFTYRKHYDSIPKERLASCYDTMKKLKRLILTDEEKEHIKTKFENKPIEGKAVCVAITFSKMINQGIIF